MYKDLAAAVSLSVLSNQGTLKLWDKMKDHHPLDLFDFYKKNQTINTQSFIEKIYGSDPEAASEKIIEASIKKNISIVSFWDSTYPPLLKEISCPPVVLFSSAESIPQKCIAIVGSRKIDSRMKGVTRRIARDCSKAGYTIVSGMALGADREAHCGTLECGGATMGILANGIDIEYPASNRDIYKEIKNSYNSLLISEYPPGCIAGKWTFVKRNRIISGLSEAVVVTRAAIKSGALITANYALEQNREIFACPGLPYDDVSAGTNKLIKDGAKLVDSSVDIIDEMNLRKGFSVKKNDLLLRDKEDTIPFDFSDTEPEVKKILDYLSNGESPIDNMARELKIAVSRIHEVISLLEIEGIVKRNGNNIFRMHT